MRLVWIGPWRPGITSFSIRGIQDHRPRCHDKSQTIWTAPGTGGIASCPVTIIVLVVGALLFSTSLHNLLAVDAGFLQKGILITNLDLFRFLNVPYAGRVAFKRDLLEKVRALPGMVSAGEVGTLPLSGGGTENRVWIEGASRASGLDTWFNSISDGYFKAMGIALLAGRDFNVHDTLSSPRVAIVNRSFARDLGLGVYPIGRTFRREATPDEPEQSFEIVGLVENTKYSSLREKSGPIAFLCAAQDSQPGPYAQLVVRSAMPMSETVSNIRTLSRRSAL